MREELLILRDIRRKIREVRWYCRVFPARREQMAVHLKRLVELADACVTMLTEEP